MNAPLVPLPRSGVVGASPVADWARHARWVLGWFRRRFGADRAEDLAQEAFVALLRNRHRIRDGNEASYLLGIVRMLSRSEGRRARLATVEHVQEPAAPIERDKEDEDVAAAVRRLPPELEQVIVVHFGDQASYEQTAAVLGVTRATVQSRLRRALNSLRRELTRQGIRA